MEVRAKRVAPREKCEVAKIATQCDGIWREHDRVDGLRTDQGKHDPHQLYLMSRLFEASEALKDVASTKRAVSVEGALFQLSLVYDVLRDLEMNKQDQGSIEDLVFRAKCLLFSATDVIRRLSTQDTAKRYMPVDHDPMVIFDAAAGRRSVPGKGQENWLSA